MFCLFYRRARKKRGAVGSGFMGKLVSLCSNNDFRRAYAKGKNFVGPLAVSYVRKNRLGITRIGITTSKKVGNAVTRSRSRRVIREAYRGLADRVKPGYDLVFVARGKTPWAKSTEVGKQLEKQLRAAGVFLPEETVLEKREGGRA